MSDWWNPFSWGQEDEEDAQKYLGMMEPMLNETYDPYIQYGQRAMPTLEQQMMLLTQNPAAVQQQLGGGYNQSPGYQWQYDQAMNGANQAAAAGGMLGTNAHQQQAANTATGLANQDYWNYYNQNANLYNTGLQGLGAQNTMGYNAANQKAGGLGSLYGNQANLAYANGQSNDQMFSSLLGAGIGAAGYALGGPVGGMAATSMASGLGGSNPQMPSSKPNYNYSQSGWIV